MSDISMDYPARQRQAQEHVWCACVNIVKAVPSNAENIDIIFDVDKDILQQTLAMEQRRDFFLIFKEAVNNAAKYAQATVVEIQTDRGKQ